MADFSIASQIGGGGQNALASSGVNPNTMLQLMQMKQTMELQRLADQRAAALHGPALTAAQQRVAAGGLELESARMGLEEKKSSKELEGKLFNWIATEDNPYDPARVASLKSKEPKLYTALTSKIQEQQKLAAEASEKTTDALKKRFDYLKNAAPTYLSNFDRIKDQNTYSKVYNDVLQAQPALANLIGPDYTPENASALRNALQSLTTKTTMSLPGGDVVLLDNGKPVGLVDPMQPNGVRLFGPGEAPRMPAQAAAPAAAAPPQTVTFRGGMESLSDTGRNAAQSVLQNFPGARITSGLRTPERNAAVGGAAKSYHLTGDAIDVVPPAGMPMNVFAAQLQAQLGPQGYTVMYGDPGHLDHVHIQPGRGMNVPRAFSPSVAATDMAAGRVPTGMMAPAVPVNAMAPLLAAQLMQPQNAMAAPQALPDIAPGLTQAAPAAGAPPRPEDYPTYGQYVKAQEEYRVEQRKQAEEQRKAAEERAKESRLPALEKEKATAKVEVETAKKEEDDLKNARNIIDELTKIAAPGGLIEQSTGSVAGRGFDIAASTFGASTEGSRAIARLGPIAARVLMTVPRFEGPQSNIDVQLYQKAAGDLANPTTPRGDRIAAAEEIARLWKKREAEILSKRGEAAPAAAQFTEGQTASNDKGERIIFRGGKWEPLR